MKTYGGVATFSKYLTNLGFRSTKQSCVTCVLSLTNSQLRLTRFCLHGSTRQASNYCYWCIVCFTTTVAFDVANLLK
jgi:hypothetical protein